MIKKYKLKNGKTRYQFNIYIGTNPLTGKSERTTRRGFKTKKEAQIAFSRIKLEIENGEFRKTHAETFNDVYQLWLPVYDATVEESTYVKTTGLFKNHILPSLGSYKIEKITVDICQQAVNQWAKKLKKSNIVKTYASKIFDFAIKREIITKNPLTLVEIPKRKIKPTMNKFEDENFYTREQLREFLLHLKNESKMKPYAFFHLLAFSGMRKGEALALQWQDINFKTNEIHIYKALSRGKDNKLYVKSTKTDESRTIKMDEETMKVLKNWKQKQKEDYLKLGFNTSKAEQLVFSNIENKPLQPSKTRKWITQIQTKHNLKKVTTHGLRHTHCSLLFEADVSIKEVMDRLGHTDVQTTMNIYAHVTQTAQDKVIKKFSDHVGL